MNNERFNKEAINIWKPAAATRYSSQLVQEIDLTNKVMKLIQVGNFFYWIFNLIEFSLDLVSENIREVLGYEPTEFNFDLLMDCVHPEDRPYFLNFEHKTSEFLIQLPIDKLMKYKVSYDFRIKRKDGRYIRLLHQAITIQHDDNGKIMRTLGIETDITHIKPLGKPVFSLIGLEGEPSYINVDVQKIFAITKEVLTKREKQILLMIMEGKLSKEIGGKLNISKQTIDTHRNNMFAKTQTKNIGELITKAIRQGWV